MKTTRVAVAAGVTPTDVLATIPAHFVRIVEDAAVPSEALVASIRQSNGTFSDEVTYKIGDAITLVNHTILAAPPDFAAVGAVAQAYAKVRTASGNAVTLRMIEHERVPYGNY